MARKKTDKDHKALMGVLPGLSPVGELAGHSADLDRPSTYVGVDEVGRGCLAGPVVACAVVLPDECDLPGLDDSKMLTADERDELAPLIMEQALGWGLGVVPATRIDRMNILQATFRAMSLALKALSRQREDRGRALESPFPGTVVVDGNKIVPRPVLARVFAESEPAPLPAFSMASLVHGDHRASAIAAASVLAKTWRDELMDMMDVIFPEYGFATHKGYGTRAHLEALAKYGPCPLHRLTFRGVRQQVDEDGDASDQLPDEGTEENQ